MCACQEREDGHNKKKYIAAAVCNIFVLSVCLTFNRLSVEAVSCRLKPGWSRVDCVSSAYGSMWKSRYTKGCVSKVSPKSGTVRRAIYVLSHLNKAIRNIEDLAQVCQEPEHVLTGSLRTELGNTEPRKTYKMRPSLEREDTLVCMFRQVVLFKKPFLPK